MSETYDTAPLLKVCRFLNEAGAYAMILNRAIRATEGLSRLADGAAAELSPQDFEENIVIKIADEVEVDVSTKAWTVSYAEAVLNAQRIVLEDIEIPYLSLSDLIRSKQTYRDQDRIDVERLRGLLE